MKSNRIFVWTLLGMISIVVLIIAISLYSYKMSPDIVNVKSLKVVNGVLKLSIINNNEKGYFKKIRYSKKKDKVYVYVIGTRYKIFSSKNNKDVNDCEINLKGVNKIYIKGAGIEKLIYEINHI